jgi:hypothetical protein
MKNLLPCLAALLLLATCTKPDPLPPVTEVGAQTFGCRIDGQPYVPDGGGGWFNKSEPVNVAYMDLKSGRFLEIMTSARDGRSVYLFVKNATQPGMYLLDKDAMPHTIDMNTPGYAMWITPGTGYITNAAYTGWLNLTRCDTVRGIYSGTFAFRAYNGRVDQSVNVTDGRFDLNFYKQKR